jgi:CRP-like cAMP-binding protein
VHRSDAVALTPVEVVRLDRLRFLNLLHNHPTLAILLIAQQHDRLREQRSSGTCCY